jgi:hypothetical protein
MQANSPTKIWVQQCQATRGLRSRFGVETALDYLVGEKLLNFVKAAERDPEVADDLLHFQAEIAKLFNQYELIGYLTTLKPAARKKLQKVLFVRGCPKLSRVACCP